MTLKCTQEEYDLLIAPKLNEKTRPAKTQRERAEEIALGTAQQKLDKANDLHEIEVQIAKHKAREAELRCQHREALIEKHRAAQIAQQIQNNASQRPLMAYEDIVKVCSLIIFIVVMVYLMR